MQLVIAARPDDLSENAVLLREFCHRACNDAAVAIAALRLLEGGGRLDAAERSRLIRQATLRLEMSMELHRLLSREVTGDVDAGGWLRAVCTVLGPVEGEVGRSRLIVDVPDLRLDGVTARRLVLVAAELLANAFKYATREGGTILIRARAEEDVATLRVADDGPGFDAAAPARGGGLGSGIVSDLVALGDGRMKTETGTRGTTVHVDLPTRRSGSAASADVEAHLAATCS